MKNLNKDACDILNLISEKGLWVKSTPLRLHLGCGEQRISGYIQIDYHSSNHTVQSRSAADIFCDLKTMNLPYQSVDEIRLHHVFEHFDRPTALGLLIRWHESLKSGGKLHIETPDIMGSARTLLSTVSYKIKQGVLRHAFGSQEATWAYHLDGWYADKFIYVLTKLGFSVECRTTQWKMEPFLSNVEVFAIKEADKTREQLLSAADEILYDSCVAEVSSEQIMHQVWCKMLRDFLV